MLWGMSSTAILEFLKLFPNGNLLFSCTMMSTVSISLLLVDELVDMAVEEPSTMVVASEGVGAADL